MVTIRLARHGAKKRPFYQIVVADSRNVGKETMSKQNERIVVGKFGATYGIRGWLKVFSYTDNPESIFDYAPWFVNHKGESIDPAVLPELPEDEFYWRELFGMQVVTTQGYDLGKVTDMLETGSNDVLVVKANLKDAFGQKERLIPFLEEQVIKNIDRTAQRIEVDWDPAF